MANAAEVIVVDASVAAKWLLKDEDYQRIKTLPQVIWIGEYQPEGAGA